MRSLELFAGGGGLALGIERAGFHHVDLIENNSHACDTLRANCNGSCVRQHPWPVCHSDARHYPYDQWTGKIQLLAAGPPCQPFSIAGKHAGEMDGRNMFPTVLQAVRAIRPQALFIENVRGLARATFRPYLDYIVLQLRYPTVVLHAHESWFEHKSRLERLAQQDTHGDLEYHVSGPRVINLVDFGVPQNRERLFIVAFRSDVAVQWEWPKPTHAKDALFFDQWITGEYWERHGLMQPEIPLGLQNVVKKVRYADTSRLLPWQTVRDALRGLPDPIDNQSHPAYANHIGIPGARAYYGHSGSLYDVPAKTLKAGDHGVPGGENMLLRADSTVRYFTVRESARLQTFPDEYVFCGSRSEAMRQIGNAVPVLAGERIAREIGRQLKLANEHRKYLLPVPCFEAAGTVE